MDVSLVFPHQLFSRHPALSKDRRVYLVEDPLFFGTDPHWPLRFHAKKLILHRASMKAYEALLEDRGYKVFYLECPTGRKTGTIELLDEALPQSVRSLHLADPVDDVLGRRLQRLADRRGLKLNLTRTPAFLTPDDWMADTLDAMKKPFMAKFYSEQRKRMKILLEDDGQPVGGKWSFDDENRKKLPRDIEVPEPPSAPERDEVEEATSYVKRKFPEARGSAEGFQYAVTHRHARKWLDAFFADRFQLFGDYEDALSTRHRVLFHSVLTPALNIGLLDPDEIIDKALDFAANHEVPLNSLEGFVRQIIGWREFMRAMYLRHGVEERNGNFWEFTRDIPSAFYDGTTGIPPVDDVIRRVTEDAYAHHIERLMVLGNFMLLCRIHPTAVYKWFMELFIDAYDWVMVPNVYGMSQFADGGLFTTKPYLSGSNYIRKMSDYPKGDWCHTWDGLFWSFIDDHQDFFLSNPRLSMMARQLRKMDKTKRRAHRKHAEAFLDQIH